MKHAWTALLALALSVPVLADEKHAHGDDHTPKHGGVVVGTQQGDFELVARPETIALYLRDHGKPMDASKASAKVTLLSGTEKQEVELKPAGDRLEAKGSFKVGPGTKAIAVVSNGGKTLGTARFTLQ